MNSFIHQLVLLQRKNFLLMWREKVRLVVEVAPAIFYTSLIIFIMIYAKIKQDSSPLYKPMQICPVFDGKILIRGSIDNATFAELNKTAKLFQVTVHLQPVELNETNKINAKKSDMYMFYEQVTVDEIDLKRRVFDYRILRDDMMDKSLWYYGIPYAGYFFNAPPEDNFDSATIAQIMDRLFLNAVGVKFNMFAPIETLRIGSPNVKHSGAFDTMLVLTFILPQIVMLPMLFTIHDIYVEREAGVSVYMESMGVSWTANYFAYFFIVSCKLTAFVAAVCAPFFFMITHTALPLFILAWLYTQLMGIVALFATRLFRDVSLAYLFALSAIAVSAVLASLAKPSDVNEPFYIRTLYALNPTSALKYALYNLFLYEIFDQPLELFGLFPTYLTWELSVIIIGVELCALLIIGSIRRVFKRKQKKFVDQSNSMQDNNTLLEDCVELNTKYMNRADVRLDALRIRWRDGRYAVNGVTFEAHKGNLTILLGPNGAGKSTIFRCLTGTLKATSGNVTVCGKVSARSYRGQIGYCPQHNPLFLNMTVFEHLCFYLRLRLNRYDIGTPISLMRILDSVGLGEHSDKYAQDLSGGMKRKLFVALALAGDAQVVLLDEPTAGMDPDARHRIGQILVAEKQKRTILLTTHYMNEADLLADRVLIMSTGQIVCNASPEFLKRRFSAGYILSVTLLPSALSGSENTKTKKAEQIAKNVLNSVNNHVPDAQFLANAMVGAATGSYTTENAILSQMKSLYEFNISLPLNQRACFTEMFQTLESIQTELCIESFGISLNSLDQVFNKVNELASEKVDLVESQKYLEKQQKEMEELGFTKVKRRPIVSNLLPQIFWLVWRQLLYHWRAKLHALLPLIVGAVAFCSLLYMIIFTDKSSDSSLLDIDTSLYVGDMPAMRVPIFTSKKQLPANNSDPLVEKFENYTSDNFNLVYFDEPQLPNFGDKNATCSIQNLYTNLNAQNPQTNLTALGPHLTNYLRLPPYAIGVARAHPRDLLLHVEWLRDGALYALNAFSNMLLNKDPSSPKTAFIRGGFRTFSRQIKNDSPQRNKRKERRQLAVAWVTASVYTTLTFAVFAVVLSIVLATPIVHLVGERSINFKHQIIIANVRMPIYWLAQYIADFFYFLLILGIIYAVTYAIIRSIPYVCLLSTAPILVLYFFASITFTYAFSLAFRSPAKAYGFAVVWHLLVGGIILFAISLVESLLEKRFPIVSDYIDTIQRNVGVFVPFINFNKGFCAALNLCQQLAILNRTANYSSFKLFREVYFYPIKNLLPTQNATRIAAQALIGGKTPPAETLAEGALPYLYVLLASFLFALSILTCAEWDIIASVFHRIISKRYQKLCISPIDENADVVDERRYIEQCDYAQFALAVSKLYKFHNKDVCAVRDLTFCVRSNECFGLLGVNGAGKTSTLDILTQRSFSNAGKAHVFGTNVEARPQLGYCPQFDALMESLTAREILLLLGRLNGLSDVKKRVDKLFKAIQLENEADQLTKHLSGGQKRRLSVGVALIGGSRLIALDEPTAGVDPATRRHIWNLLEALRYHGLAILLTTHSMEECETLCTRVGFMSRGSLIGLGTNQRLKSKFGSSFLLTLAPNAPSESVGLRLNQRICAEFGARPLHDKTLDGALLTWQISRCDIETQFGDAQTWRWSELYAQLDELVAELADGEMSVRDSGIVQSSMEEVFVRLANIQ